MRNRARLFRLLASTAMATVLFPSAMPAEGTRPQEPAAPGQAIDSGLAERLEVRVVNVDVVVTDKKGQPVTGLGRDDFALFEDGQPVAIDNFFVASGALSTAGAVGTEPGTMPVDAEPALAPVAPTPEEEPPLVVVYVDNLQLEPLRRNNYLDQVRGFLDSHLAPGGRVMVVSHYHGIAVETPLAEPFAGDADTVERALAGVREAMGEGIHHRSNRRLALDQIRDVVDLAREGRASFDPCTDGYGLMTNVARGYSDWVRGTVNRSLGGLSQLTASLAGVPGRKVVLYLSNGLDLVPGFDLFHLISEVCPERATDALREGEQGNLTARFHRLTSLANADRISFYTIDAAGLVGNSSADVSSAGPLEINGRTYDVRPSATNDRIRRANRQNTIFTLANETGGRAMLDGNDIRADLARMSSDLETYYALGFTPQHPHDGRVHRLRVELTEPCKGCRLRYRRTYLDKSEDLRLADRTLSTLLYGFEDNPLGIAVAHGEPVADPGGGAQTVPLRLSLPIGALLTIREDDAYVGRIEVVISIQDRERKPVTMRRQEIPIRIAAEVIDAARDEHHMVEVAIPLEIGETVLAITVRDRLAAVASYLRHRIRIEGNDNSA